MRYMVLLKATQPSSPPPPDLMEAIAKLGEGATKAGALLDTAGLAPSAEGARVQLTGGRLSVTDGPFTETKELIAGFWLWQVRSMDEAVEWLKRAPFEDGEEVEIRQVFETEDFGDELTPELREREAALRARTEGAG